jgi:hypothetical protein
MRRVILCKSCDVRIVQEAAILFNTGANDNRGVDGKMEYIYLSSCDLIHNLQFVAQWIQNGPAFILHNHQDSHELGASRQNLGLGVRTVCNASQGVVISYYVYRSDLVYLGAH